MTTENNCVTHFACDCITRKLIQYDKMQVEIEQLKEYNDNCISRTLHDARVGQLEAENLDLKAELKATNGLREMDIKQCMRMNDEITALKSKLEIAKKGLEFYNETNIETTDDSGLEDIEIFITEVDSKLEPQDFGYTARQALKEINEG